MTRRAPLPPQLGISFATSTARAAGVSGSRLRAADLERPFHGVRAMRQAPGLDDDGDARLEHVLLRRATQYAHRMTEHEFFTHVTAAVIWGIPLPSTALGQGLIDVGVFSPRRNPESSTVRGHAVHTKLARVQDHPVTGLRVASPASTWAMLGAVLSDPYDLVAAGDAVVRSPIHRDDPMALASPDQLHAVVAAGRRRGVIALREALARVRTGSASRPETWTRLTVVDAGLPEPIANFDVWDDETWLARVDLAYPDLKIAIEYEGRHHLHDVAQWTADIARYERLVQAGWQVIRVTHDEVFVEPRLLVARVRRAIARASR